MTVNEKEFFEKLATQTARLIKAAVTPMVKRIQLLEQAVGIESGALIAPEPKAHHQVDDATYQEIRRKSWAARGIDPQEYYKLKPHIRLKAVK